jgi:hypothetical protein
MKANSSINMTKVFMFSFLLFGLTLSQATTTTTTPTTTTTTTTTTDPSVANQESEQLIHLPHEVSMPIAAFASTTDANLKRLVHIIGFLPNIEQNALLAAYNANTDKANRLFDITTYSNAMLGVSSSASVFRLTSRSISNLLTVSSKTLRQGLGCLLKTANEFGSSQEDNTYKQVLKNIQDLNNAQIQVNNCRARHGNSLVRLMKSRRRFLLTTINVQSSTGIWNDVTNKDYFIRFPYTNSEMQSLVYSYTDYANCQLTFRTAVNQRVLESQQMIAQMPACKGVNNPHSGFSSTVTVNPTKTLNSKGVQVGVNDGNGIRPDGKTQSNYALHGGFGLGNGGFTLNTLGFPALRYQANIVNTITKLVAAIQSSYNGDADWKGLVDRLNNNLHQNSGYRPTPDLHSRVLYEINESTQELINEFHKGERGDVCNLNNLTTSSNTDYLVICDNNTCKCIGSNCPTNLTAKTPITFSASMSSVWGGKGFSSTNNYFNWNFNYNSVYIATFCLNNARYIFSQASDNLLGNVIDFMGANITTAGVAGTTKVNLGANFSNIVQNCLANFEDGKKDDKDACRDVVNEKCGIELDYTCSQSSLYQEILSNPVPAKALPFECDESNLNFSENTCLNWINRVFLSGTMTLKPSGFLGQNLYTQNSLNHSSGNVFRNLQSNYYVSTDSTNFEVYNSNTADPTATDTTVVNTVQTFITGANDNEFFVDGAYKYTFPTQSAYFNDVSESSVSLKSSASAIKISMISLVVVLFGLLI